MRICSKCQVPKDESEFNWKVKNVTRYSQCKPCSRASWREFYKTNATSRRKHRKRVAERNAQIKADLHEVVDAHKNKPCADCGGSFNPWQMDFDHVRGKKEGDVGQMVAHRVALERILKEIKKCEVVCANCHRQRTHERYSLVV